MKLASPFQFSGQVIHGEGVGRTIGFPTANLDQTPSANELKPGVYVGSCQLIPTVDSSTLFCLAYFGPRLVFGELKNRLEVYIYDFDQDIYGSTLTLNLTHFLRDPQKVENLSALAVQLTKDRREGAELLKIY